ncbi:MAG: MBOAT family O-acyltransferase [Weeksellaceae bacterium]|nr:MBOAT family O-acyltransferase [Weeksellaceae bacterium]
MNFASLEFAVFVPIVFVLYWFVLKGRTRAQNFMIIIASYIFYGWWDYRFLGLIALSSLLDFLIGIAMDNADDERRRKLWLTLSIVVNLSILAFFKYYNFFLESLEDAFTLFGHPITTHRLDIILPVGISFYTLQTMSYSLDVYHGKVKPTRDPIAFFSFVSFFPQLVAGPIERASNFLPQFLRKRVFSHDAAVDGMRQILWGLFKKVVVADNIGLYNMEVMSNLDEHNGSTYLVFMLFQSITFYCDFSGYSDIAIGTGRLFGFNLMRNFHFPFYSRNIAEFWQRWHISLVTWIRVYIVLALKKDNPYSKYFILTLVFFLTGLWHGARWGFVVWGLLQAVFMVILYISPKRSRDKEYVAQGSFWPNWLEISQMLRTNLVFIYTLSFVFLASLPMTEILKFQLKAVMEGFTTVPVLPSKVPIFFSLVMLVVEWFQRGREHALDFSAYMPPTWLRWVIYFVLFFIVLFFGTHAMAFIYFQF